MKKFAMIPINCKRDFEGNLLIRRVLISYKFKTVRKNIEYYHGTKFIIADQYFYSYDSSLDYEFKDKYYILKSAKVNNGNEKLLLKKRKYHHDKYFELSKDVEFKCNNIQQAVEKFNSRNELR